jgi:hypothetical protein
MMVEEKATNKQIMLDESWAVDVGKSISRKFYGRVEYVVTRHAHNVKQRIQTPFLLPVFSVSYS